MVDVKQTTQHQQQLHAIQNDSITLQNYSQLLKNSLLITANYNYISELPLV